MKLAEALILRADYQRRLSDLQQRILRNAKVQEGDPPAEDPNELISEFDELTHDLMIVIQRINKTNIATELKKGVSLTEALAERDTLRLKHDAFRELAKAATITQGRYTKSEVKFKPTVNVANVQSKADKLAKKLRDLDSNIQAMNWMTDIIE